MKTEDEARKCWCPFARAIDDLSGAAATARLTDSLTRCMASRCMAWRPVAQWRPHSTARWEDGAPHTHIGPNNETRVVGYCGLAGKP